MSARGIAFVQNYVALGSGGGAGGVTDQITATYSGTLAVTTGQTRLYVDSGFTILSVRISLGTTCAGASVIADVNLNGSTIFSTQANRPTITAGTFTALSGTPNTASATTGDYFTVDIDQVGSVGTEGRDLVVSINLNRV